MLLLCLTGCDLGYLGHVVLGEAKLLTRREPVEELLRESSLNREERQKIQLILNVKSFAVDHLGLEADGSYTTYVPVDGPYVSYALSAAAKDTLSPYLWDFPFVGALPYKGFFRRDRAAREERKLARREYDTYLRGVAAYSTLGYFDDPITSPMLRYGDGGLIETVIHELLHRTVWLKGDVDFNERLARFVGEKGTVAYLENRRGSSSPELHRYMDVLADTKLFEERIDSLVFQLNEIYRRPIGREEKLKRREEVFAQAKEDYRSILPQMRTGRYIDFFERNTVNNALILSFQRYHKEMGAFEITLDEHGGSLAEMISTLKGLTNEEIGAQFP